jgi:chromatin segregation and condensation protein Rec8/ScpA/Scc1 (kleisin family)
LQCSGRQRRGYGWRMLDWTACTMREYGARALLLELKSQRLMPGRDATDMDEEFIGWEERDVLLARLLELRTYAALADAFVSMFERALKVGSKLNFWKTNPMLLLRNLVRWPSERVAKSTPSMVTLPESARVRPPRR